ncbi:Hypothetical predicted protein [Olea europaea subsp. europaea]|uniref:Uncharacterized protein n=1 Tax=Olea europaea subsp. europaea TaxID=158383 RepID=A0A8S0U772_OLEEU|nr:Hypothetical predicted protein [Olea europaea subsp. europaea]
MALNNVSPNSVAEDERTLNTILSLEDLNKGIRQMGRVLSFFSQLAPDEDCRPDPKGIRLVSKQPDYIPVGPHPSSAPSSGFRLLSMRYKSGEECFSESWEVPLGY